jgi:hypothetical protein
LQEPPHRGKKVKSGVTVNLGRCYQRWTGQGLGKHLLDQIIRRATPRLLVDTIAKKPPCLDYSKKSIDPKSESPNKMFSGLNPSPLFFSLIKAINGPK